MNLNEFINYLFLHKFKVIGDWGLGLVVIELALAGIAENGRIGVIGRNDDETSVEIEDVGRRQPIFGVEGVRQSEILHRGLGKQGLVLDERTS